MSIKQDNILTTVLEKKISRRSFVKWSAALGATASMSGLVMQTGAKMAAGQVNTPAAGVGGSIVDWKASCCLVCHSWCHIACGVDANGHVRKIEGGGGQPKTYGNGTAIKPLTLTVPGTGWTGANIVAAPLATKPDDANHIPTGAGFMSYAAHNKGRICAKGNDGVEHLYDPDRVKYPLRRTAGRGEGQWERLSWDEALTEIANVLRELAGVTTKTNGDPIPGARGQDLRHRLVTWVGRNETFAAGNFSQVYGTPNHVEHTSLCELGRHVAGRTMWGHHWSSVDLEAHADGVNIPWPGQPGPDGGVGPAGNLTLDSDLHDNDCYIEWGGNPCEAKIPHTTWANHLGDRRRRNLQGFSGAPRVGTTYGRIMCIDVRQSNTAAWADEYLTVTPGSDGALALGLIRYVMETVTSATLQSQLDKGHMGGNGGATIGQAGYDANNRLYYGLFKTEEGGLASGSDANSVPTGKSLESYVMDGQLATDIGASVNTWLGATGIRAKVMSLTGLRDVDVDYLGSLFANGAGKFLNVVTDTYRGPVKHTNGVYNTRAIRALQILAPNYSAAQFGALMFGGGFAAPAVSRGGYNAPGGFQSDKNWVPWGVGGGTPNGGGNPGTTGLTSWKAGLPVDQGMKPPMSNYQRVDDWDYDYDVPRWRGAYARVDQNLSPGIRHSVGLHAFVMGSPKDASKKGPFYYQDWQTPGGATFDTTFKVEALLSHKNAPGYARPQQNNEIELFTAVDGSGNYLLKHFWSIDVAMGDGTRFADIVLPESTYLERYSRRSGEGAEFNFRDTTFFRLPVYESMVDEGLGQNVPRHMYDVRQNAAIFYELARKIEPGKTVGTKIATAGNGDPLWNGKLYDAFDYAPGDTGSVAGNPAYVNDGEWAIKAYWDAIWNAGAIAACATAAGAPSGTDFMRSHGYIFNPNDRPAYWRSGFDGDDGGHGSTTYAPGCNFKAPQGTPARVAAGKSDMLTVFNRLLDTVPDMERSNGTYINTFGTQQSGPNAGCFFGGPVYIPTIQQPSVAFPLHLTTYKVNVHTQSRTANLPRLTEILGNSWAVIHPTTAAAYSIANGDSILVSSETGGIEAVAKVSEKAQVGCVHISHSFGHRKGVLSVDDDEGNPNRAAFGEYKVGGAANRSLDNTLNNPAPSPTDAWTLALPPSAPGKGTHCNIVIAHHLNGDTGDGSNIATDPIGGDQAWFDTKVKIEKI